MGGVAGFRLTPIVNVSTEIVRANPFENPTAFSNYIQMISIFALGASLTNVFGRMVGNQRQGWAILAVMGVLFIACTNRSVWSWVARAKAR